VVHRSRLIYVFLVATATLLTGSGTTPGATINVPADQPTIQAGIDAAVSGVDEVVVAPETYFEAINFNGKAITVRSASGNPADTIINGTGNFHVVLCVNSETASTVLEGLTITGGNANALDSPDRNGGGMYNENSSPTVTDTIFIANSTGSSGGGMYNKGAGATHTTPVVIGCRFVGNSATQGGGMYNQWADATVTN